MSAVKGERLPASYFEGRQVAVRKMLAVASYTTYPAAVHDREALTKYLDWLKAKELEAMANGR